VVNAGGKVCWPGRRSSTSPGPVTVNRAAGELAHVGWLRLNVAAGGVTVNSLGLLAGFVQAPAGTVTINAWTFKPIAADRLVVNASGRLIAGQ
jgi:hypothetical protein